MLAYLASEMIVVVHLSAILLLSTDMVVAHLLSRQNPPYQEPSFNFFLMFEPLFNL